MRFLLFILLIAASSIVFAGMTSGLTVLGAYVLYKLMRFAFADSDLSTASCRVRASALRGRVVWVTGASSGIGEGLALELSKHGAMVVVSARREGDLYRVAKACGTDAMVVPMDVTSEASRRAAVEAVYARHKKVDILINNAGISQRALAVDVEDSVERKLFELNYFGTVALTKDVVRRMRRESMGHIVVISSVAGKLSAPASASYSATKHAIQGFFNALRIEEAPHNVGVTLICPGPVVSDGVRNALGPDGKPLGPLGDENVGKMPTARCAELSVVGISNGLEEIWISQHPILVFCYLAQYAPALYAKLANIFGQKRVRAVQEGKGNINA